VAPWTQSLRVGWKPELHFFETRTEVLRELEEADSLIAFRWGENFIGARIGQSQLIELTSYGAHLLVAGPDADASAAHRALKSALDLIKPTDIEVVGATLRFLLPLVENYDEARRRTADHVIKLVMPDEGITDWSVLLDGHCAELGAPFQIEFGVVENREALERIAGTVGRVHVGPSADVPVDFWRPEAFPAVAVFMAMSWLPWGGSLGTVGGYDDVASQWAALVAEGDRMANKVYQQLQQDTLWDAAQGIGTGK
jgi:hypothetical protein